ncbi:MAG: thioredoxin family protein [Elusimicrobiota bacterium]|jgi:small redox-active disulfide protein 2
MKIQILGGGCRKCATLKERTEQAVRELGLSCEVVKVSDMAEIARMGVMRTPALAVDGVVKLSGQLPSVEGLKELLKGLA